VLSISEIPSLNVVLWSAFKTSLIRTRKSKVRTKITSAKELQFQNKTCPNKKGNKIEKVFYPIKFNR
jgi:hypothetical protein